MAPSTAFSCQRALAIIAVAFAAPLCAQESGKSPSLTPPAATQPQVPVASGSPMAPGTAPQGPLAQGDAPRGTVSMAETPVRPRDAESHLPLKGVLGLLAATGVAAAGIGSMVRRPRKGREKDRAQDTKPVTHTNRPPPRIPLRRVASLQAHDQTLQSLPHKNTGRGLPR